MEFVCSQPADFQQKGSLKPAIALTLLNTINVRKETEVTSLFKEHSCKY